jgi:hypothetical protein
VQEGLSVVLGLGLMFLFLFATIRMGLAHEERKLRIKHGAAAPDPGVAAAHIEIAALKERVQVLEKLVTDDDRKLAHEIERLRPADARS